MRPHTNVTFGVSGSRSRSLEIFLGFLKCSFSCDEMNQINEPSVCWEYDGGEWGSSPSLPDKRHLLQTTGDAKPACRESASATGWSKACFSADVGGTLLLTQTCMVSQGPHRKCLKCRCFEWRYSKETCMKVSPTMKAVAISLKRQTLSAVLFCSHPASLC